MSSPPMGWRSREFLCLSLCEEGGAAPGCVDLGYLSRLTVQSASDLRRVALRDTVRADGGRHSEYFQEIPIRFLILPENEVLDEM